MTNKILFVFSFCVLFCVFDVESKPCKLSASPLLCLNAQLEGSKKQNQNCVAGTNLFKSNLMSKAKRSSTKDKELLIELSLDVLWHERKQESSIISKSRVHPPFFIMRARAHTATHVWCGASPILKLSFLGSFVTLDKIGNINRLKADSSTSHNACCNAQSHPCVDWGLSNCS